MSPDELDAAVGAILPELADAAAGWLLTLADVGDIEELEVPEPAAETAAAAARAARRSLDDELARLEQAGSGEPFRLPAVAETERERAELFTAIMAARDDGWRGPPADPARPPPPLRRRPPLGLGSPRAVDPATVGCELVCLVAAAALRAGTPWPAPQAERLIEALGTVGRPVVAPALCLAFAAARPARADDAAWMIDVRRAVAHHPTTAGLTAALDDLPLHLDDATVAALESAAAAEVAACRDELRPFILELLAAFPATSSR